MRPRGIYALESLIASAVLAVAAPANAADVGLQEPGPAFNCDRAATKSEKTICADEQLGRLDRELSVVYARVLAAGEGSNALRNQQIRWVRERDKCPDSACMVAAYRKRIAALEVIRSEGMTNEKAQAICKVVVDEINDGSIEKRLLSFQPARDEDEKHWRASNADSTLGLSQVRSIIHKKKARTFGLLGGGGSCGTCTIVDIDAKEAELYPPVEDDERLRWASWGYCDSMLLVDGEPIIVTGAFANGNSRATLVAWAAPDGAKRVLCAVGLSGGMKTKSVRAQDAPLCRAVMEGSVDVVPWEKSFTVENDEAAARRQRWDEYQVAELDLDMDGRKDFIVRYEYASGAGCGSFQQWLMQAVKKSAEVYAVDSASWLNGLPEGMQGPIPGSDDDRDGLFSLKMFSFRGKPYLLSRGSNTSASVYSLWNRQSRSWCDFNLFPQHKVEAYYPVEVWPAPRANR